MHAHTSLFLVASKDNGTLLKLKKKQRKGKKTVLEMVARILLAHHHMQARQMERLGTQLMMTAIHQ